ncbi:MAG TPA: TetR/AcrR family transcriptional regulator [Thermomicrobiaceae bacterium]|nr:TetR/AcrR family transcriptional regulator [Thermomicrobiaceae bacterium]
MNPAAHTTRREAFLDAAQRLILVKGYEQMSVQDVLDELEVSRGALYHYFDSKAALLDGVLQRMLDAGMAAVAPVVSDPDRSAPEKLSGLFAGLQQWKAERRDLVLELMRVWYSDENALVRDKLRRGVTGYLAPMLDTIIAQGRAEGVFTPGAPDTGRVMVGLLMTAQDLAGELYLARQAGTIPYETVAGSFAAYQEAFERILGVPAGSLPLVDEATLRLWFG